MARPLLSAANGLTALIAAEETRTADRAKAVALAAASCGVGAGLIAVTRSVLGPVIGWRGLFLLALVPLVLLPLLARVVREPTRFMRSAGQGSPVRCWSRWSPAGCASSCWC